MHLACRTIRISLRQHSSLLKWRTIKQIYRFRSNPHVAKWGEYSRMPASAWHFRQRTRAPEKFPRLPRPPELIRGVTSKIGANTCLTWVGSYTNSWYQIPHRSDGNKALFTPDSVAIYRKQMLDNTRATYTIPIARITWYFETTLRRAKYAGNPLIQKAQC